VRQTPPDTVSASVPVRGHALQLHRCQYSYLCTSKASKTEATRAAEEKEGVEGGDASEFALLY
jgi:hypothetical protein